MANAKKYFFLNGQVLNTNYYICQILVGLAEYVLLLITNFTLLIKIRSIKCKYEN